MKACAAGASLCSIQPGLFSNSLSYPVACAVARASLGRLFPLNRLLLSDDQDDDASAR
jgi:hypothetical protein